MAKVQTKLLPKSLPRVGRFQCAARYQPWSRAGGDYYNAGYDKQGRFVITMADVSGHGAGAAVLMAMFRVIFDLSVDKGEDAAHLTGLLNEAPWRRWVRAHW